MKNNYLFNATVCILGILILSIHIISLIIKKGKRKDELCLLDFFAFTTIHFSLYLLFTIIKMYYSNNILAISFYTSFFIMNNIEIFLLYRYVRNFISFNDKINKTLNLINIFSFLIFVFLDIVNIFTGIFFISKNGEYIRTKTMFISFGYQAIMLSIIFVTSLIHRRLKKLSKVAFSLYCLLPTVAIILQIIFKGYAVAYASIIISAEILFVFLTVEKNLELSLEKEKTQEAQIKIMISQIQPHFIYNSLSAISTLIEIDQKKAQTALDEFTEYLRSNLSALTETKLIPFEDELKHIQTYIDLEKLRFENRINVNYDLKITNYNVPALSIQPIVENAIKHGILKKLSGGTVNIITEENDESIIIKIIDDGIGFNMNDIKEDNKHFGINNIKYRINKMCNGDVLINSELNKGTTVIIIFNK